MPDKSAAPRVWLSVMVLFAINILNFYDRHVPGALVEPIRKEFHLDDSQIGLIGSAFIWLYAIVGVPLGLVADKWSRKKLLAWGVVIWTALTASTGFATTYAFLVFSRVGVGLGEAACAPTATSWLGDLFPPAKRSRVLALFMLGVPVGGALGYFFSGPLAQAHGWRIAMVTAAIPAVLLVPALLFLREPERGASEPHGLSASGGSVWQILRVPTFWWIIVSGALLNFNAYAFATFLPAFFSRLNHLSLATSNYATGTAYLCGGLLGGAVSGLLGDWITRRRKDGRMLCAAGIALATVPLGCVGVLQPGGSLPLAVVFLGLTYAALSSYYGFVYSSLQDIIAPNQRASAMAIYFMAMYLLGASFGPLLTGKLSDVLAHRAAASAGAQSVTEAFKAIGLQQAMLVIPALSFALAWVLYMGSRTIAADMDRRAVAAEPALAASD